MNDALFDLPAPEPDIFSDEPGENTIALEQLLKELEEAGLLTGKTAALAKSLQVTARALDRGLAEPKVSVATTTLNRLFLDGLAQLPEARTVSTDEYDTLSLVIAEMTKAQLAGETTIPEIEY